MWYEICSFFVKGVVIDLINEFGIRLNDECLERLELLLKGLSPLGFSVIDFKENLELLIILRKGLSRVCYLRFIITADDYENIGEVFE